MPKANEMVQWTISSDERAEHKRGAERHEIAGDMRSEKTLQRQKAGGVDVTCRETQQ